MAPIAPEHIEVIGANANNLRDIDVRFPKGGISMVVGVSGSGKSSLLRNTLACEGNLRLETFLGVGQDHLEPPNSDAFIGRLPPTLHVGQRAFRASSRTTVATASGLLALLRRMFIRWSVPVSGVTGLSVPPPSVESYLRWLLAHHQGRVVIWAIPLSFVANDGLGMAARLRALGIATVVVRSETDAPARWQAGRPVALNNFRALSTNTRHLVECEIGAVSLGARTEAVANSLRELLTLAFAAGEGRVFVELEGADRSALDSRRHWVSPGDPGIFLPATDHLLSFNAPDHEASGACPDCRGVGRGTTVLVDALVAHPERSLHEGAFALWTPKNYRYVNIQHETIEGLRGLSDFDPDLPWSLLGARARRLIMDGAGNELVADRERGSGRKMSKPRRFGGFRAAILERVAKGSSAGDRLAPLVADGPCPTCNGTRWSVPARALRLGPYSMDQLLAFSFRDLAEVSAPGSSLAKALEQEALPFVEQLHRLAQSFVGVGLEHLSGDRGMLETSEGESRRLRLAAVLDGRHSGLCLLLDEPARGLHDEDVDRLSATLTALRGTHTLILNEHRHRLAAAADFFVELGPGAGEQGGALVHTGTVPKRWWARAQGLERSRLLVPARAPALKIRGARVNNLEGVDVSLPLGRLVCLVGVSGSGKSSFVRGVLLPALRAALQTPIDAESENHHHGRWTSLVGAEHLSGVVALDQRAPPANRRSTVATFLGLAEPLRKHFASLPSAKSAGLLASDFGLNAGAGRCQECLGIGEVEEGGHWSTCPSCGGSRFGPAVLAVLDNGLDIAQLLACSIGSLCENTSEALEDAAALLQTCSELGVGHLALGRRLDTISGGELQRLRVARELNDADSGRRMFVLDEPAAGLHRDDVARLLQVLDRMVAAGHSVVVVEHNLELVGAADWVVEFGPGSGPRGGRVVAAGTPEQLGTQNTPTGRMLRTALKGAERRRAAIRPRREEPSSVGEAAQALRWLRRLLGDDVPPQTEERGLRGTGGARPTVVVNTRALSERRVLEYGGLDRELATILVDQLRTSDACFELSRFASAWNAQPNATLAIHPLVREMYTWGAMIPRSAQAARKEQLAGQGIVWRESGALAEQRADGGVLQGSARTSPAARERLVESALLIGGGYVELRYGDTCLARHATRPLDLHRGLVGPQSFSALDLLRHGHRGMCLACRGRGRVRSYNRDLVFGDLGKSAAESACLHPNALAVLRGVHRNEFLPFLRRMVKEGLWTAERPVADLPAHELEQVLYGYWHRPGPGSFLKTGPSNPKEVSSWLRWDGLFAHLHENAARGQTQWRETLLASERFIACPKCAGLGLRPHVALFELAGRSYPSWLGDANVSELHRALLDLAPSSARATRRRDRLVQILAPLVGGEFGEARLCEPLKEACWALLARSAATSFTDMPLVLEDVP